MARTRKELAQAAVDAERWLDEMDPAELDRSAVDPIAAWLDVDPNAALTAAGKVADEVIGGHLGVCVSAVLFDQGGDAFPDPNIHELAYTLLKQRKPR